MRDPSLERKGRSEMERRQSSGCVGKICFVFFLFLQNFRLVCGMRLKLHPVRGEGEETVIGAGKSIR